MQPEPAPDSSDAASRPLLSSSASPALALPALVEIGDQVVDRRAVGLDVEDLRLRSGLLEQVGEADLARVVHVLVSAVLRRRCARLRRAPADRSAGVSSSSTRRSLTCRRRLAKSPSNAMLPRCSITMRPASCSSSSMSWLVTTTVTPRSRFTSRTKPQDVAAREHVEAERRLVEEQHLRLVQQRQAEIGAHALAEARARARACSGLVRGRAARERDRACARSARAGCPRPRASSRSSRRPGDPTRAPCAGRTRRRSGRRSARARAPGPCRARAPRRRRARAGSRAA